MDFQEYPLLNTPNLVAVVLRTAAGGASVEDCARRLARLLDQAGEHPPVTDAEMRRHLERIRRFLAEARLLEPEGHDRFHLTPRGEEALERHPAGFDTADLMRYPEYAEFVHRSARDRATMDRRIAAYDRGYEAYRAGRRLAENPYSFETVDHLSWENGWFEALDEDVGEPPKPPGS